MEAALDPGTPVLAYRGNRDVHLSKGNAGTVLCLAMGTKQHKHFCETCNAVTNHVTSYSQDPGGGLRASVRCMGHSEDRA